MKRLPISILKKMNGLLAGILALLGFSGCNDDKYEIDPMYGCQFTTFSLRGKVQNASKDGIPDIKIEVQLKTNKEEGGTKFITVANPAITNQNGIFNATAIEFPTDVVRIIATDIDGDTNGSYQKDSIDIKISNNDFTESLKELPIIELKEAK